MGTRGKPKWLSEILNLFDNEESKKFDQARKEANLKLLEHLKYLMDNNPSMRFGQILQNFGFIKAERPAKPEQRISWQNEFYVEPQEVLERVERHVKNFKASRATDET